MDKLVVKRDNREYTIKVVGDKLAREVIADVDRADSEKKYLGLYITQEANGNFTGIDNTDGDAWTEEFFSKEACIDWLLGENDIDFYREQNLAR